MQPSRSGHRPIGWLRRLLDRWSRSPHGGHGVDPTSMFNAKVRPLPTPAPHPVVGPSTTHPTPPTAGTGDRPPASDPAAHAPAASAPEDRTSPASQVTTTGLVRIHTDRLDRTDVTPPRTVGQALELARRGRPPEHGAGDR